MCVIIIRFMNVFSYLRVHVLAINFSRDAVLNLFIQVYDTFRDMCMLAECSTMLVLVYYGFTELEGLQMLSSNKLIINDITNE